MMRSYLILNLRTMNDLPLMERWLLRDHAPETIAFIGPILERYTGYRAVPAPDGALDYGYYNWRMTEHWWRESPFRAGGQMDQGTLFAERWPPGYTRILGMPEGEARTPHWGGRPGGPNPPVFVFVSPRPSEDFLGRGLTMDDGTVLRWVHAIKYPEGVSREEGDDWYVNVHAPEVCRQPGLKRFVSYHVVEPKVGPWVRVSELWYENADAWRNAVIQSPPAYTKPKWAKRDTYPFVEPWVDFVSTFLLEAPTNDFLRALTPYIVTA
jgi:hypothetical protein